MVIEAEGLSVEEVRKDIELYFQAKNLSSQRASYNSTQLMSYKVTVSRTEEIRDWGLMSDREAHYTINGYPPDDDVSIDELIGGNS